MKIKEAQKKHELLWNTIVDELSSNKCLLDTFDTDEIKEEIFYELFGDLDVFNSCFACEIARSHKLFVFNNEENDTDNHCDYCPIVGWTKCELYHKFYKALENDFYEVAIIIAKEIANAEWKEENYGI